MSFLKGFLKKEDNKGKEEKTVKLPPRKRNCVLQIMSNTGLDFDDALALLEDAVGRLGITPAVYSKYLFFDIPAEGQAAVYAEVKQYEENRKKSTTEKNELSHEYISEKSGMTEDEVKAALKEAKKERGIAMAEYRAGRYWELSTEDQIARHRELTERKETADREKRDEHIRRLAELAGCDDAEAVSLLEDAWNRLKVAPSFYIKHRLFETAAEKQAEKVRDIRIGIERKREKKESKNAERLRHFAALVNMSEDDAYKYYLSAKDRLSISLAEYISSDIYMLPENEQEAAYDEMRQRQERDGEIHFESAVAAIMKKLDCSRETAENKLRDAKERFGIGPQMYRRYRFYEIPEEEHEERREEILDALAERTRVQHLDDEQYLAKIMKATGWSRSEAVGRLQKAKLNCGATWKDFFAFKFWEIPEEEQKTYFTTELSLSISDNLDVMTNRDIFVNKERFLDVFSDYANRKWCISDELSREEFAEKFAGVQRLVYKPSFNGNSGNGIEIFDAGADGTYRIYDKISEMPRGLVEEYVFQHDKMKELYPNSVNTLRVATVRWQDAETGEDHLEIPYAMIRIGSGGSSVDNFTTGGMVAAIDMEKGVVCTDAVNVNGDCFASHPDTGTEINGFEIPMFFEAIELARKAASGIYGYVGWDVALSDHGPLLIEANIDPGNRLMQMPFVKKREGRAELMRKYAELNAVDWN